MALWRLFQYQAVTKPVAPPERITEDKWHQPWSEPRLTAKKSAGFAIALMASGVFQGPPPPPPSIDVAETTSSLQISKSFQYPAVQEPVPIPAEVITVDKWFVSLSEPVRLKLGLGTTQQQAFQPDTEPNVADLDSWYRPLNEPVRIKLGLRPEQQQYLQIDTEPTVSFSWFAGLSEPVRIKQGLAVQQQKDLWWTFTPTEVITLDKWYNWLSEPVRQKLGLTAQQQQFFQPDTEPNVSFGWIYGLSEPVRLKAGLGSYLQQTFTADTEPTVSFGWNYGYSEPVRTKPGLGVYLQRDLFWNNQLLENVTVDKWFGWLSEPVRLKPGLAAQQQQFFQPDTEPNVSFSWFAPLTEPVRLKPGLGAWQQQFFQPDTEPQVSFGWIYGLSEPVRVKQGLSVTQQKDLWWTFFPTEIVTVDKWFNPLSEPSVKIRRPVAWQQDLAWSTFTPPTFNDTKWFTPFSEPVRVKLALQAGLQQFFQPDPAPQVSFSWFGWLSEPVRQKPGLTAQQQQFFQPDTEPQVSFGWSDGLSEPVRTRWFAAAQQQVLAWSTFTPTTFNDTKWFTPFSEPVRLKVGLQASLQQPFTFDTEPTVSFGWFEPLSEPVRLKIGLRANLQQFFTFDTEPTVSFGWSDGLSEPVRTRLFQTAQQSPLAWSGFTPAATTDIRWFTPLSEPVRVKAGLSAAQQQFWTIGKLPDVQSIISQTWDYVPFEYSLLYPTSVEPPRVTPTTVDSWFVPLSEPVRVKLSLLTGRQQFFAIGTKPSVSFSWFEWLSDPVRLKPGTHVSRQSVTTIGTKPTVSFSWFEPFSEPVRVKLGLRPSAQQFLALVKAAPFPEAVLEAKWHQPWSEPVRYRWFSPAQQQFLAQSPRITAQNITISLTATETGDIFSGNLRIGFCPQADVSIIEVVNPNASNTSTVYVPTVFAEVSIIEIPQNSDRVLQTIALTDAFGNVLTDAFGNVLTITRLVLVTGAEVVVDVSVIEKC